MDIDHEARRQQWLLRSLRGETPADDWPAWLRGTPAQLQRGLHAYRANAAASAGRALAAAYPTVQQLLGAASFAALAAAHWQAQPPRRGDLAAWGEGLPGFISDDAQLAGEPYLGDVARLDWALHQAALADDDDAPSSGLQGLADADPAALRLRLRAGHAVLVSAHPVHSIWLAHGSQAADRFAGARQALAAGCGQAVRVRRQGLQAVAEAIDAATAGFEQGLLAGLPLSDLLLQAGPAFDFEAWFIDTLRRDGLAAVLVSGSA
ncbi:MAG: putative DNA-binding domain-containing protein [Pseudomonadota bacterium]